MDHRPSTVVRMFYTFGSDHADEQRGLTDPVKQYVEVVAPAFADHRGLLMSWLGSNRFAFEYDEEDFNTYRLSWPVSCAARIVVEEVDR
jgi:hypothetical protein